MMRATARLISINASTYCLGEHSTRCTCFDSGFRVHTDIYTRIQYQKNKKRMCSFSFSNGQENRDEENKMSWGNNNINVSIRNETSFWSLMFIIDIDCLDV